MNFILNKIFFNYLNNDCKNKINIIYYSVNLFN